MIQYGWQAHRDTAQCEAKNRNPNKHLPLFLSQSHVRGAYTQSSRLNWTVQHQLTPNSSVCVLPVCVMPASPPTSRPLAAHFPLQSKFIYWTNCHPASNPKKRCGVICIKGCTAAAAASWRGKPKKKNPGRLHLSLLLLPEGEQPGLLLHVHVWHQSEGDECVYVILFVWGKCRNKVPHRSPLTLRCYSVPSGHTSLPIYLARSVEQAWSHCVCDIGWNVILCNHMNIWFHNISLCMFVTAFEKHKYCGRRGRSCTENPLCQTSTLNNNNLLIIVGLVLINACRSVCVTVLRSRTYSLVKYIVSEWAHYELWMYWDSFKRVSTNATSSDWNWMWHAVNILSPALMAVLLRKTDPSEYQCSKLTLWHISTAGRT